LTRDHRTVETIPNDPKPSWIEEAQASRINDIRQFQTTLPLNCP
jgi:hypothetical protein